MNKCPLCANKQTEHYLSSKDYFLSGEPFDLFKCSQCGLIFTHPFPDEKNIHKYYKSVQYFSHPHKRVSLTGKMYDWVKNRNIRAKFEIIHQFKPKGKLLDIGCGSGDFIHYGKKIGWEVCGLEPDEEARKFAAAKTGENILHPEQTLSLESASFDVITLWHVLEHVYDLDKQLTEITRLAKGDALIVVALPNHRSHDAKTYGSFWAAWDLPRHLYHFDPNSIAYLFAKHGYSQVKTLPMKWDAYYVALLSEKYKYKRQNYIRAIWRAFISNRKAAHTNHYSSLIYCFKKKVSDF